MTTTIEAIQEFSKDKSAQGRFTNNRIDKALKFKQECHHALAIISDDKKGKYLRLAEPATVQACIEDVALLGLTLNPDRQYAYLIPRKINGVWMCQLYTSWRGLKVVGHKFGGLQEMDAQVVYSNELCKITQGTEPSVQHEVILNDKLRGDPMGAYCIAYLNTGRTKIEYMDAEQIGRCQKASDNSSGQYSPWTNWPEEMWRKCPVRRGAKHWSGSPELAASLEVQNRYEGIAAGLINQEPEEIELVTEDQTLQMHARLSDHGCDAGKVLNRVARALKVDNINELAQHRLPEAEEFVAKAIEAHKP